MCNSGLFAAHGLEIENQVHLDAESTHTPATHYAQATHYTHQLLIFIYVHVQFCCFQLQLGSGIS